MIFTGIDIGSITTKVVLLSDNKIIGSRVGFTGYNAQKAGEDLFNALLAELGIDISSITKIISTGYGRNSIPFAHDTKTEITCHAIGAHFIEPGVRTVIDIGGQDSKAIALDETGNVKDFVMNDKCAAGTGRFLEVMARAMESDLEGFGDISISAKKPATISSTCTVFAESEVISLISKGESRENIIAGIHNSVAKRVAAMAKRVGVVEPVIMTGGVAKNPGVVRALENELNVTMKVYGETAQINGAIGAAVLASRMA